MPPVLKPHILTLSEIQDQPVGGKAKGLAELARLGLPVPPAFVIVEARDDEYPEQLEEHYKALGGGKVAVRSSALGEDGAEASFAGQYETVLNVEGLADLKAAISQCVASLFSARAQAYKSEQTALGQVHMCVVVQVMVDAACAGVLFSVDPVSARRDRLVVDAVAGLGESLVSGHATPDHFQLDLHNRIVSCEHAGAHPVISDPLVRALGETARRVERFYGAPVDMEWAVDRQDRIFWLQARPITTLPADLNELDTDIASDEVLTTCNVQEMMPGAVAPLTFSVSFRAIEHGMQFMQAKFGGRKAVTDEWFTMEQAWGHLFINLTALVKAAEYSVLVSPETIAQAIAGRNIPELHLPPHKRNVIRRLMGAGQFLLACITSYKALEKYLPEFRAYTIDKKTTSQEMISELHIKRHWFDRVNEVHLLTSSHSGFMEGVLQSMVSADRKKPTAEENAEAARLLAGADNVESAVLVEQLDAVVDAIAQHPDGKAAFHNAHASEALAWLQSPASGVAGEGFAVFLSRHGHRAYRELCLRTPSWGDDPESLVQTMQAALTARYRVGYTPKKVQTVDLSSLSGGLAWILPKAHNAVRRREQTKSMLAKVAHLFKQGYRHLGELLVQEGHLPEVDLIYFFTHDELLGFVHHPDQEQVAHAIKRREAMAFQEKLEFNDIYVGRPEPVVWQAPLDVKEGELIGRPVSRGIVEGYARVAHTVEEARGLQPGEILIAPITDVGWTPYFSLIAGLATDIGSAVSHGAVIAREYGLPCIVNLRMATRMFNTGDYVRLDAEKGILQRIEKPV